MVAIYNIVDQDNVFWFWVILRDFFYNWVNSLFMSFKWNLCISGCQPITSNKNVHNAIQGITQGEVFDRRTDFVAITIAWGS